MRQVSRAQEFESVGWVDHPPALVPHMCLYVKNLQAFHFTELFCVEIFCTKKLPNLQYLLAVCMEHSVTVEVGNSLLLSS